MPVKIVKKSNKTDNVLLVLALVAVIVSVISAGITYNYLTAFRNKITGYGVSTGTINLTIESTVSVNFTTNNINWSSGTVTEGGVKYATLNTSVHGPGNVTNGNWTGNDKGLVIENTGNVNVSLQFAFGTNAGGLLGGSADNRSYLFNVSNNESGSCTAANGSTEAGYLNLSSWLTVNTSGTSFCPIFQYLDDNDTIRIDIALVIPSNAIPRSTNDTITATVAQS